MRKHLLNSFDKIYILDLHGSVKRKETAPDGTKDENVFDIQTGVSINIFIKTSKKIRNADAELFKFDLYGRRDSKYSYLNDNSLKTVSWVSLKQLDQQYSFKKHINSGLNSSNSFKIDDLFIHSASGITTERDDLTIQFDSRVFPEIINDISNLTSDEFRSKYSIEKDGRDWTLKTAKADIMQNNPTLTEIMYRPFDKRSTLYTGKSKGFHSYPRASVMCHFIKKSNLGLVVGRQGQAMGDGEWNIVYISNTILDSNIFYRGRGTVFCIYSYIEQKEQGTLHEQAERTPNLNADIVKQIAAKLKLKFTNEKENTPGTFAPIDILDYIYAVLHSPAYREKYKEFLKIDFPRVPYPTGADNFWQLVKLGGKLRQLHLLESDTVEQYITQYPVTGTNVVDKIRFEENYELIDGDLVTDVQPVYPFGRVYINDTQFFQQVPKAAWDFYIGGYQPAQKWLKDRKGRTLGFEDILHYQKMIVALWETGKLMQEIDGVIKL